MIRPSKEEMYLRMAEVAAQRSSCQRIQVGAVITDCRMRNVLSIGYNGPPVRQINTCPGDPSSPGACGCIHAETNALLKAPFTDAPQLLFVTLTPCVNCAQLLLNSQVQHIFYREAYRLTHGLDLLTASGIICEKI